MSKPILQIKNLDKSFSGVQVLTGITFDLYQGEILAILGPSGCGKSTLLSIIAGIEEPDKGSISWSGIEISALPAHRRGFGLMFQEDVLFPHMDVYENVAFGLSMQNKSRVEIDRKVIETLEMVDLLHQKDRNVNTLSGGEQQRVALARSIAPQPGLLMLDEPLSSLDRTLRERLLVEIKRILKELHQTALYITHDQEEAFSIADRVILMRDGIIEQVGTPEEIYHHPANGFVARFLGFTNIISGRATIVNNGTIVKSDIGDLSFTGDYQGPISFLIRPESAEIGTTEGINLHGTILDKIFQGNLCHVILSCNGLELKFIFLTGTNIPEKGEEIKFSINPDGIVYFL